MQFELIENGVIRSYKHFGETHSNGGMDLGLDFNYPNEINKKGWHSILIKESECMAAATLSYLFHIKEEYGDIVEILNSKLFTDFINKYFDKGYFSEPHFIDGDFGRFSNYGELSYPEKEADDKRSEFTWNNESIKMKFMEKCFEGDWKGKIFIDTNIEEEFKSQLKAIIELFNSN